MDPSPTTSVNRALKSENVRYCGRMFTPAQIQWIDRLIREESSINRVQLSRRFCEQFNWRKQDGGLKEMSCRVAMLRMHRDGLICLPPPRRGNGNGKTRPSITGDSDPQFPVEGSPATLGPLTVQPVETPRQSSLWNELIERYHYLGYKPLPGAQIRYMVVCPQGLLALMGFGAAALKVAPRDRWIGWDAQQREHNLHQVVNNARFLLLPWVSGRNLASHILSLVIRQLPQDWENRYRYRPCLLETFVEKPRFRGTCYRAANWIHVGQTQGRGKLDRKHRADLPVKNIFLYPLAPDFRQRLLAGS